MTDLEVGHSGVFKEQQRCRCSRRGGRWIVEVFLRMLALNEESGILPSRGVT